MCLVFKTTYIDRGKPLREGAFFFTRMTLFPPLDKRNARNKAKGLRVTLERSIGNFFDEFAGGVLCNSNVCTTFAPVLKTLPRTKVVSRTRENDSVAQLVEQVTLNHWVVSSSLTGVTKRAGTTSQ